MTFQYPLVLFALVLPVALLVWTWGQRWSNAAPRTVLPFDHSTRRSGWTWWALLGLADSLPAVLLAVAILIVAGPQKYGAPEAKRRMTNIQFCVDVSGSMTSPFGEGTRYDGAMKAIERFLDYRKGDSFGLTFFGDNFIHWCPLTTDPSAIRCALPFMRPETVPYWFNGTNIGKALQGCKKILLEREEGDRMILLITDGIDYDLDLVGVELTKELKSAGVIVFGVIVGYHEIQDGMVHVTRGTGGDAFTVDDPEGLKVVFRKIDQMRQAKVEKTIAEPIDNYQPFALAGMIVLGLANFCLYGIRYVPW